MSKETLTLSLKNFQALAYDIQKLSRLADQLDIVAYQTRSAVNSLQKAQKDICIKEQE
jgi:hypothetical protein